jgi:hypothetical protein
MLAILKRSRKNSVKLSSHLPSGADESDTHTITAPADRNCCLGSASTVRRRQGRGRLLIAHDSGRAHSPA